MNDFLNKYNWTRYLYSKWRTFEYNYGWAYYVNYINGWIPKFAFVVPILGYLILFNDEITNLLSFEQLINTNEVTNYDGLKGSTRLKYLYFGLISLGVSNFIYYLKKPFLFKFGTKLEDFKKTGLETFTLDDFFNMHQTIQTEGHITLYGKYYDSEWEGFLNIARDSREGTNLVEHDGSWEEAKNKYGSLLRKILNDHFARFDRKNRISLSICILLSTIGYILLLIPSGDLFIKVCISTFF